MRNPAVVAAAVLLAAGVPVGRVGTPKPDSPTLSAGEPGEADLATRMRISHEGPNKGLLVIASSLTKAAGPLPAAATSS